MNLDTLQQQLMKPSMNFLVHHPLCGNARRFPEKEALVCGVQRLTYAEVEQSARNLAQGMISCGLKRGDRVGVFFEPSVQQVLAIESISMAGGVFVPINHRLFPDQVRHIASDCGMKGLMTSTNKYLPMAAALGTIPCLEFLVVDGGAVGNTAARVYDFEELRRQTCSSAPADHGIGGDLAAILYTSGSTGKPKGVMLSHSQILAGSEIVSDYLGIGGTERILLLLPLSFDAGLNQLMTTFQAGATLVVMTFVFPREIVGQILKERITGLAGVPTLWGLLTQPSSTLQKHEFPDLRYITNTGGAMPLRVLQALRSAIPKTQIFLMYGLTEAFRSTYLPPSELDRRPGSIGKAIPNTEILVVNEMGNLCGPHEVGELVHRGPTVSMGYWGDHELTAKVLRPNPFVPREVGSAERVCYSGDLVKTDEEGFIYFVGRKDQQIKSSGFRVSPTEVEEVLFQGARLQAAGVVGVPDEILGEAIKAFVVPQDGQAIDSELLIEYCAQHLPRHMVPKMIEVLKEMPMSSNGKVDYPALRHREALSKSYLI